MKIIQNVSYLIKYCKISLLYIQGAVASQIPGIFFYSPCIYLNDLCFECADQVCYLFWDKFPRSEQNMPLNILNYCHEFFFWKFDNYMYIQGVTEKAQQI